MRVMLCLLGLGGDVSGCFVGDGRTRWSGEGGECASDGWTGARNERFTSDSVQQAFGSSSTRESVLEWEGRRKKA